MAATERDPTAADLGSGGRRFVIDDLRADDADAVAQAAALLVEAFRHWTPADTLARKEVAAALEPDRICLAARDGAALLGWVGAIPAYSHAWELHPLVVREDARGLGIGRSLVAALEERVHQRRALTLYLSRMTTARRPAPARAASTSFRAFCPTPPP